MRLLKIEILEKKEIISVLTLKKVDVEIAIPTQGRKRGVTLYEFFDAAFSVWPNI